MLAAPLVYTVITMELLLALVGAGQVAFDVITTVIVEGLAREVVVYVELVSPAMLAPFLCHWNVGEGPPFVGVAVKVTDVPALEHIDVDVEVMLTDGVTVGLTTRFVVPAALVHPATVTVTL